MVFYYFHYFVNSIYESAPWSMEAWSRPLESSPLASTRLAGTENHSTVSSNSVTVSNFIIFFLFFYFVYFEWNGILSVQFEFFCEVRWKCVKICTYLNIFFYSIEVILWLKYTTSFSIEFFSLFKTIFVVFSIFPKHHQ